MRIFIDIGHPAHVHYFKHFIRIMNEKGHKIFVTARDKEVTFQLLRAYNIPYHSRGKGKVSLIGKFFYLFKGDLTLTYYAIKFKPDIFLSFGSSYAAHASFILKKPHIAFDDTEHAKFEHMLYVPFTEVILTPTDFKKSFNGKQIKFDGTMDLAYLHPKYFTPDLSLLKYYNINSDKSIFLLRFVSWTASHDKGYSGFSFSGKMGLIKMLSKHGQVLISAESDLPKELKEYSLKIPPEKIHDLMYKCDMFIGESGSMATEAAILGTPSVIVNSSVHHFGVFKRIIKYNSLFAFSNEFEAIDKIKKLLSTNFKLEAQEISKKIIGDSINLTDYMIWFIENYPNSTNVLKKKTDYQYRFK